MNDILKQAIDDINRGKVICIPTETVYGLVCDATNPKAVDLIYQLKGRDNKTPLAIFVKNINDAANFGIITDVAKRMFENFCPGAITIIVKQNSTNFLAPNVAKDLDTIAIRIPDNKICQDILNGLDHPIVATSANPSGQPAATDFEKAVSYFKNKIDVIVDGGKCQMQQASTIVDTTCTPIKILRQGPIEEGEIRKVVNAGSAAKR